MSRDSEIRDRKLSLRSWGITSESAVKSETMSLVDYASSSEDEEVGEDEELQQGKQDRSEERQAEKERPDDSAAAATVPPELPQRQQKSSSPYSTYRHRDVAISSNTPFMEKLPDASLLLSSPSFSPQQYSGADHSSCIAATVTEMASRKRGLNGSASIHPPNKQPRGNLPHLRNMPDTKSGAFIPPQLKGRSNVVTEDVRKLFVNRHREPSG